MAFEERTVERFRNVESSAVLFLLPHPGGNVGVPPVTAYDQQRTLVSKPPPTGEVPTKEAERGFREGLASVSRHSVAKSNPLLVATRQLPCGGSLGDDVGGSLYFPLPPSSGAVGERTQHRSTSIRNSLLYPSVTSVRTGASPPGRGGLWRSFDGVTPVFLRGRKWG